MEVQCAADRRERTPGPLPDPATRVHSAHNPRQTSAAPDVAETFAECTDEKSPLPDRAGTTARSPILRGGDARVRTAKLVSEVLFRRWERGDESCSTRAIAQRCKVNPRVVHDYRHGEKPVPWALAWVLPIEALEEINESIVTARAGGRTWRWALALVRRGLDWIEERGTRAEDAHEVKQALREAQRRILDVLERLDEEEGRS